jgi:peptide/nickel transport system substrate-binding protein
MGLRNPRLLAVLCAVSPLVGAAWILSAAPPPAPRGGRLVIGVRGDVTSFNLYTATNAFSQEVTDLLFPRLADEQDDFRDGPPTFRPFLASSWEISSDRRMLTLRLDPHARWSDGRDITASDVVFSERAASSAEVGWVGGDVKELISGVAAPDPHTVVIHFTRDYPYGLMDALEGSVLPAHIYEKIPFTEWPKHAFLDAGVAGGPFLLARYERGALIELARNPSYFRSPRPLLDSVAFRILPDETTLVNELLSGGIDFMENVSEEAAGRIEGIPRLTLVRVPDLSYTFVCWNTSRPLFSDPRVRRALTLAIDRRAILEGLLPKTGRPSDGPILSFMWAHDPSLRPLDYDPPEARRLLREAGWQDPGGGAVLVRGGTAFRFELETNQGSSLRADVVQMIAAQLRKVGIEAVPRIVEFGAFIEKHERHEFDAFVSSWRESTKVDLKSVFHSASIKGGYDYGSYADAELDALIDRARAEGDAAAARDLWRRAARIVVRDQPFTFLFERDRLHAVPRRLRGMRLSPRSAYAGLEEWSLAADPASERTP